MRLIPDWGRKDAKIVLIGEAPGKHEELQGKPFVGPSGMRLDEWWREVGLRREDFYITNVVPYRPPGNDIKKVDTDEIERWTDELHIRLAELDDAVLFVPTGDTALCALTNKSGITKWRGSLLQYQSQKGKTCVVVPTIHPAATFRSPYLEKRCRHDWRRIADELHEDKRVVCEREHFIRPTIDDIRAFCRDVTESGTPLAVDIETPRETRVEIVKTKTGAEKVKHVYGDPRITCIGFSADPAFSITIPTTDSYWGHPADIHEAWRLIRLLLTSPNEKILQNGLFDAYYLADHGIWLPSCNWKWDTLAMHHAIDANDDHDLAYMASVYTREPYWKDEAKDPDEVQKYASNLEALWTYNGKDAAVTRELYDVFHTKLAADKRLDFYDRHYTQMFDPLLSMMRHGVRRDQVAANKRFAKLTAQLITIQDRLAELAGEPLVAAKSFSPIKLRKFLYETLRLPKKYKTRKGKEKPTLTIDEIALRQLRIKYPERAGEAIDLILDHRRFEKLQDFLKESVNDPDGRVRCSYRFTTDTGRLSSSKNPRRTGMNLQNVDRDVREVYIPDEECLFVEADLSQAESRVVGVLTHDPMMIELARAKPWEFDVHRRNASAIFHVPEEKVTKEQRYLGKKAIHASNYGMHGNRLSEELLKDGYVCTPKECEAMIQSYLSQNPAIPDWHRRTRMRVMQDRRLTNSWGRELLLHCERLGDDVYRRAYAFVPQSEVADLLNQWGLIPLHWWLKQNQVPARINLQVHDALVISCPRERVYDVMVALRASLERPRLYEGVELTIPVEWKVGTSWKGSVEWKQFPSKEAVWAAVEGLR